MLFIILYHVYHIFMFVGEPSYPDSAMYTPTAKLTPVTFNEGVRTPVLQYAHPELGVQPAKATPDEEQIEDPEDTYSKRNGLPFDSGRQSQFYNNPNSLDYYR